MRDRSTGSWGRRVKIASVVLFVVSGLIIALPASAARAKCFGRVATIVGTNGDDELIGTRGRDVIAARGGVDFIDGRGGRDLICAGSGEADFVFAGPGHDRIAGGRGFDAIFPGPGNDFVDGGPFPFDYVSYEGLGVRVVADLSRGVLVAQGRDTLRRIESVGGGESDDVLVGTEGDDTLLGFGGNDTIVARGGNDFINSGAGDDTIRGGPGDDVLDLATAHAGPGLDDDTFATGGATIDLTTGRASGGADVGEDLFTGIENVGGTLGDDTIIGDDAFNALIGFEGDDAITLGPGVADPLGVANIALPGPGDDTVTGGPDIDAVDYSFSGFFEPFGPVNVDLAADTASGPGLGNDVLTSIEAAGGTVFDDVLMGDGGANVMIGFDGSDTITGGAGDDVLDGDVFVFGGPNLSGDDVLNGGSGTDTCLGGETTTECELFELSPPAPSARAAGALDRTGARMDRVMSGYHLRGRVG